MSLGFGCKLNTVEFHFGNWGVAEIGNHINGLCLANVVKLMPTTSTETDEY